MTTKHETLFNYLRQPLNQIRWKYNSINSGGCGLFALALHRELKRIGIHTDIIGLDYMDSIKKNTEWNLRPNFHELVNKCNSLYQAYSQYNVLIAHIILRYKTTDPCIPTETYYIDCTG